MCSQFYLLLFGCLVLKFSTVHAQKEPIQIIDMVVEESDTSPIEFATVLVGNKEPKKPITGTTTDENGGFVLETDAVNFYIDVSFIGFTKKTFENPVPIEGQIDLGAIA